MWRGQLPGTRRARCALKALKALKTLKALKALKALEVSDFLGSSRIQLALIPTDEAEVSDCLGLSRIVSDCRLPAEFPQRRIGRT